MRGVRAIANGAKAIQCGNAKSGGEVTVGRATGGGFAERKAHLFCEGLGACEKLGAVFAFQRRAIKASSDLEFDATTNGLKRTEALFQRAHIGQAPGAEIEIGLGGIRYDVGARATIDEVRVDSHAVARIVPLLDASDLCREFVDGIDALIWIKASVSSTAVDHDFSF